MPLAYFVARDRGCAYAPMNGTSINLGPRGRLFENSVEHQQAVLSGVPCFAGFTLFQFSRKPVEPEVIDSGLKPSRGLEIRNHFRKPWLQHQQDSCAGSSSTGRNRSGPMRKHAHHPGSFLRCTRGLFLTAQRDWPPFVRLRGNSNC